MRLSTKGRFAVTAMIDVALRENAGPVSLADIAARHQISLSYLEQMFSKLRQRGLVESTRGPGGGYTLARGAEAITVADIIGAVEGDVRDGEAGRKRHRRWCCRHDSRTLGHAERQDDRAPAIHHPALAGQRAASHGCARSSKNPCRRGVYKQPPSEPVRTDARPIRCLRWADLCWPAAEPAPRAAPGWKRLDK